MIDENYSSFTKTGPNRGNYNPMNPKITEEREKRERERERETKKTSNSLYGGIYFKKAYCKEASRKNASRKEPSRKEPSRNCKVASGTDIVLTQTVIIQRGIT